MRFKMLFFGLLFFASSNAFGQGVLGKDYDFMKIYFNTLGGEYSKTELDSNTIIVVGDNYYIGKLEQRKLYTFKKTGQKFICEQIDDLVPYNEKNWNSTMTFFTNQGYELTDYVYEEFVDENVPQKNEVFMSLKNENHKVAHYMSFCVIKMNGQDWKKISYFLNTSEFKTK